jgi:hypothetical protein
MACDGGKISSDSGGQFTAGAWQRGRRGYEDFNPYPGNTRFPKAEFGGKGSPDCDDADS